MKSSTCRDLKPSRKRHRWPQRSAGRKSARSASRNASPARSGGCRPDRKPEASVRPRWHGRPFRERGIWFGMLRMNAKDFRSKFTMAMSAEHTTPLPSAPAAQCSIDPPGKCPPPWISVTPFSSSNFSPCQNLMQRSACLTQLASLAWRCTGTPPTHGSSRLASCRSADAKSRWRATRQVL
jgi:hypothetical protein